MKNTRIYDRVPVKDVRVKDPQIGTRTPQILISRKGGEYLRGDVLDANATTELAKSIHVPDGFPEDFTFTLEDGSTVTKSIRVLETTKSS